MHLWDREYPEDRSDLSDPWDLLLRAGRAETAGTADMAETVGVVDWAALAGRAEMVYMAGKAAKERNSADASACSG